MHIVEQQEVVTYMCEWNRQCIIMCSCWSVMHTMLKHHAQMMLCLKCRNTHIH